MHCSIVAALGEVVPQFVSSCVKALFENSKMARELRARADAFKQQRLEWERKYNASQSENRALRSENRALRKELGEVKVFATAGLVPYMIYHPSGMPFSVALVMLCMIHRSTLVDLAVVLGSELLPITSSLKKYVTKGLRLSTMLWQSASRQIRLVFGHLVQFVERIRSRIREWKWKAAPVSGSFRPSH